MSATSSGAGGDGTRPYGGSLGTPPAPARRRNVKPCGTHAAYVRHWSRSEPACEPCVLAERLYQRDRFRRTRENRYPEPVAVASLCLTTADGHLSHCTYCGEWRWADDPCQACGSTSAPSLRRTC